MGKRHTVHLADGVAGVQRVIAMISSRPRKAANNDGSFDSPTVAASPGTGSTGVAGSGLATLQPPDDVSIGLTLAARGHAIDLAYHGKGGMRCHIGTDGSSTSQRAQRFGACVSRGSFAEIIFGVVRPTSLRLSPVDIAAYALLGDGDPYKEALGVLFAPQGFDTIGVGHATAQAGPNYVVEVFVVLTSAPYVDKPVAWMSAAQHTALSVVAPPYLDNRRDIHASLMAVPAGATGTQYLSSSAANMEPRPALPVLSSENFVIGARTPGFVQPPEERLYPQKKLPSDKSLPTTNAAVTLKKTPKQQAADAPEPQQPQTNDGVAAGPTSPQDPRPTEVPADTTSEHRARLERFYTHYAPHKLPIVDSALNLFEGREEELFFTLVQKYGPEPPTTSTSTGAAAAEVASPPAATSS